MSRNSQMIGPYQIQAVLGRGSMGVVYQAVSVDQQPVAIKTLRSELLTGPERRAVVERFSREAEIGMHLHHPNIVRVLDHGEQCDVLYLAMEFIAGQELGKLVESNVKLSLAMRLALMLQLLNALAYVHGKGIIHRDIKPANILVRPDYTVALTDFGIAHVGGSELTQTGELLGSPLYMSPEQLRGEPIDHRADLFAAGIMLYFLLTRRRPFEGNSLAALMRRILYEDPPAPSAVNRDLLTVFDPVLEQALSKDRQTRFATALDFAAALRQARRRWEESKAVGILAAPEPESSLSQVSTMQRQVEKQYGNEPLDNLAQIILRDAPVPGCSLHDARGDWLERVQLFARRYSAKQDQDAHHADAVRNRLIHEFSGAFLDYAGTLNQRLFRQETPELLQISADFARLDLLRMAVEEIRAEAEARRLEQTQILFVSQVMSKVNQLIRHFLDRWDISAQQEVASLLMDVEELIVLAERLLQSSETTLIGAAAAGGGALAEFVDNACRLSHILGQELYAQVEAELRAGGDGPLDREASQPLFMERLRYLGLIYRFAARLEHDNEPGMLRKLSTEVYTILEGLTYQLLKAMSNEPAAGTTPRADQCWLRLSAIANLVEQFAWPELVQRILLAIRSQVFAASPWSNRVPGVPLQNQ